jgi:hypothetical protein
MLSKTGRDRCVRTSIKRHESWSGGVGLLPRLDHVGRRQRRGPELAVFLIRGDYGAHILQGETGASWNHSVKATSAKGNVPIAPSGNSQARHGCSSPG